MLHGTRQLLKQSTEFQTGDRRSQVGDSLEKRWDRLKEPRPTMLRLWPYHQSSNSTRSIEAVACSAIDLRLAHTSLSGSIDVPLLAVRIMSDALSGHSLDVSVISSRTNPSDWTWVLDVSCNGEVLVHSDAFTGKIILPSR
jgi:hypothetical protein